MTPIDVLIKNHTISLVAIGFSFALLADAEQLPVGFPQTLGPQESAGLWPAVARAKVIYVGETHDKAKDHTYELRLVRGMIRRRIAFAIGWEMFDHTQQALLDAWDHGAISLQQLFRETGFDRGWAIYSPIYARILQTARRSARSNVALNAPPALVSKVARGRSFPGRSELCCLAVSQQTRRLRHSLSCRTKGSLQQLILLP